MLTAFAALLVAVLSVSCQSKPTEMSEAEKETAKKEISARIEEIVRGANPLNVDAARRPYSDSPEFLIVSPDGSVTDYETMKKVQTAFFGSVSANTFTTKKAPKIMKDQPTIDIRLAQSEADFKATKQLILAYVTWLGIDLSFQNFDAEMAGLSTVYAAPNGGLLLATVAGVPAGVAGIKKFTDTDCELKRMFVGAECRKLGVGKQLLTEAIILAKNLRYETIKLDTADFMKEAINLYVGAGFVEIPPYRFNPHEEARYFELVLNQ